MTYISRLEIRHVRNLEHVNLNCAPRFNLMYGENGSGKTSILEAIYLLALGRSFRSHLKSRIINHQADNLSVFAQIETAARSIPAGIQKFLSGETKLRLQGQTLESVAEVARLLPIQLLNPDSYELLNSGSRLRRQFMDWGVFHVEPSFHSIWSNTERILKQRNAALKQQRPGNEVMIWDDELNALAVQLNELRRLYIEQLLPVVNEFIAQLPAFPFIHFQYYPGWDGEEGNLLQSLKSSLYRDLAMGYTRIGPHRADLKIKVDGLPVQDILSRGQQKLLVIALRFAQANLLYRQQHKSCLYLIDDLASELDGQRRGQVVSIIKKLHGQFFITGVDLKELGVTLDDAQMFHVEQGSVR